uniref:Porin domain-containing protein n=1 Tax=Geobacter sp. (strain M21) TaxID=443144 RepID=C6E5T3_GEOSM
MKKIIALSAVAVLLTSSLASAAALTGGVSDESKSIYGGTTTDATTASATLIGKLSKNVKLGANYDTGGYALETRHSSGNTRYGTAFDATAIYKQEGATAVEKPSTTSYSSFSTWTAM